MKDRFGTRVSPELLAAYVDGEVTPSQQSAVERELARSPELRSREQSLREITRLLAAPAGDLETIDLAASFRVAAKADERRRGGASTVRSRLRGWWVGLGALSAGATVAAAITVMIMTRPANVTTDDEFRAKSAAPVAGAVGRWAGVNVYRLAGTERPERLGPKLAASDGLLFSYTNLGPQPFEYLMIFGVDATGEVRWFFPAYEQPGSNPSSIHIMKGQGDVPLPEVIHHPYPRGPLTLRALFSHRPLHVAEIEAWVAGRPAAGSVPGPGTYQQVFHTLVK